MEVNSSSDNENINEELTEINIIYNIKNKKVINLFGFKFVENNKKICKMIIDDKEYEIESIYNVEIYDINLLTIKLTGIKLDKNPGQYAG